MRPISEANLASSIYDEWDALLTPEEVDLVRKAQAFCDSELIPFAEHAHRTGSALPKELVQCWAALGLQGLQTPRELGGQGASYLAKIRVVQVLSRSAFAAAFSLNNSHSMVQMMATQASVQLRERYLGDLLSGKLVACIALTERGGGSDLAAMKTTAKKVSGGWILNGEKAWITNATISDLAVVGAQTGTGTKCIGRFLVPLWERGAERLGAHPLDAGTASGVGGLRFNDAFVPEDHLLEQPGEGFKRSMAAINGARVHVAAMATACLERALEVAVSYGQRRTVFGKPLLEHQGLRWQLADVANELEAANALVLRAARLICAGESAELPAAHAKKFATSSAVSGIERCMQSMGANALSREHGLHRQLAEVKMASYADGTTEILNERIGSHLVRRYP
ncbi:acyl-CoA/acyl-ACP dehydrogenase [Variovorax sp. LjRoot175]|uniref:acyl-CoA dehydrogenase family protein n=1 Tax=Variovorax sp. LjRoot175 TaxID=3342276 RepID=UPI003ED14D77